MKKHTIELTEDQLRVVIGLFHVGAASIAGDVVAYVKAIAICSAVENHEKVGEQAQDILVKALDPAGWERAQNQMAAQDRRN